MLSDKSDVFDMLRCPKSGSRMKRHGNTFIPESDSVYLEYEIIDDCPVLINYADSVLKKDDRKSLSSVISRTSYKGLSSLLKKLISPPKSTTALNVSYLMRELLSKKNKATVLIVGGGSIGQCMDVFYKDKRIALVSFDIYLSPNIQFIADGHHIPLADNSFDAVIVQAVLEHVLDPNQVVSEIYRVLRNDGFVYAETPFLQHVHEGPYDFTRFTESGHRYLFKRFELVKSGASAGAGTQLLWSLDYFTRALFRSKIIGKVTKLFFFWLQYLDRVIPEKFNVDAASGVFFLGKKVTTTVSPPEIIAHYKGSQ